MPSIQPASDLTAHLGYWLRHVSNHVSQAFARKVEAHGVTVAEWVLMRHLLEDEALAPSRLAERMGMTRGAISKLADRLIAKSMLVRVADPEDGRAQTLSLASAGRALVPKLAALADLNDAEFFDHLAPDDRAVLLCTLREIVEKHGLKSMPVD
ncbi:MULTISPECIES: MarR family winged helix-turn-helix transcriptional regulator [Rhizobium/Agrobacterium group]|uniref:Transcriptional regulator n=1 Tax=Allorhizobium ampelinum (strain ATCC BAA-846 / DSM 112012 / S4) TaxID=311402 RepID=B9K3E2_ALLAM|nr:MULTISPECIES: MarR family transcriptional regulator [Rhizobium/Agrobacterium group]ACM39390.1 Transcriptional regulator [Allorhizobium ampelinum S4]UJL80885.1 MarR family transcriptional regulator [Agrobacterium vitis]UJL86098.1 MarR family transcriptional regulator [Agrobacterium vitis]BCH67741.1 transcriptional regulator [Agrobacterium vitis]